MPNSTYFPVVRAEQIHWYANMAAYFPTVAAELGFSAAETDDWVADCLYAAFVLDRLAAPVASFALAVTGYVNLIVGNTAVAAPAPLPAAPAWPPESAPAAVAPGIGARRHRTVARLKTSVRYSPVIGALLRVEGASAAFQADDYVARVLSARVNGRGQVQVAFSKAGGRIGGINLYLRRDGDVAPGIMLGRFTRSPAVDPTPSRVADQPEERIYTAVGVIDDQEIGQRSPGVAVLVR